MGGHSRPIGGETVEWYTPPGVFEALGVQFDLDPCAPPGGLPWIPAKRSYCLADDGLLQPWSGRVWMNPPYGPATATWMQKLAGHGDGIALVFARTETEWWHQAVCAAAAVCFIRGRLTFVASDGQPGTSNAGAPSALVAFGDECAQAIADSGLGMTFAVNSCPVVVQGSLWDV